mmetsp:Transcript_69220/g.130122  ORF Transcript_69220/g.130122 Transcript_69220/m.130122 type:complete len:585 (+) Transcript_69220:55-1809(+)
MMDPSTTPGNSTPTTPRGEVGEGGDVKMNLEAVPIILDKLLAAENPENGGGSDSVLPADTSLEQIDVGGDDGVVQDPGNPTPGGVGVSQSPTEEGGARAPSPSNAEAEARAAAEFGSGVADIGVVNVEGGDGGGGGGGGGELVDSSVDGKTLPERMVKLALSNRVVAAGWETGTKTWDKVAEASNVGLPKYDQIEKEVLHVHDKWKEDGYAAATKIAATTYLGHASHVTGTTYSKTKSAAVSTAVGTKDWVKDTTTSVATTTANVAVSVASKTVAVSKPYVERVLENPSVDRVVGGVTSASVGVGSMVSTVTSTVTKQTKERVDLLRGNTPEAAAAAASEAEAWRQVLEGAGVGGHRGEELVVPARDSSTSAFFVKANSVLQWRFRVAAHDIGFAIRLRVQGDGGATEVDVFSMQKYACGVTVQGEWSPATDSQLIVVWDNGYSYLREKTVAFQAAVKKDAPATAAAAAATAGADSPSLPPSPPSFDPVPAAPAAAAAASLAAGGSEDASTAAAVAAPSSPPSSPAEAPPALEAPSSEGGVSGESAEQASASEPEATEAGGGEDSAFGFVGREEEEEGPVEPEE